MSAGQGEGAVLYWRYQTLTGSRPPFLRRNLRKSIQHLCAMGQNPSRLLARPEKKFLKGGDEQDHDFPDGRPLKRRRILGDEDSSVSNRQTHELTVSPSKFYAPSKKPPRSSAQFDRIREPVEFRKALRIDVTEIHSSWDGDDALQEPPLCMGPAEIKCRCTVQLSCLSSMESPDGQMGHEINLVKKAQTGLIQISGVYNEIVTFANLKPFVFTAEEISVNRRINMQRLSDTRGDYTICDLSDEYQVTITLECVGESKLWPPFAKSSAVNRRSRQNIMLESRYGVLDGPVNRNNLIPLNMITNQMRTPSEYSLRTQTRWSLPGRLLQSDVKVKRTIEHAKEAATQSVKQEQSVPLADTREASTQLQPESGSPAGARSTRGRVVNTYNLKTLSAQAQGKSPRKRKAEHHDEDVQRKRTLRPEITICYYQNDGFDNLVKKQQTFSGFKCHFCCSTHRSIEMLRFHWQTEHDIFNFELRSSTRMSYIFDMTSSRPNLGMDGRILQLGRPLEQFDLEKCLNGDESWTKAREGPEHNHWPSHVIADGPQSDGSSSRSSSPRLSRYSTPNTAGSHDDPVDAMGKTSANLQIPRPKKTLLVPRTSKPLFHTITKQVLHAGEELPDSDDDINEDWFIQKHRDLTNDFRDVTEGEKEYINRWTPFAMKSEVHLPETIAAFVELDADWFAESAQRQKWFVVHMGTLVQRGVVTEKFVHRLLTVISAASSKQKEKGESVEQAECPIERGRGINECSCREHVSTVDRVVCMGRNCKHRLFHRACLATSGVDVGSTKKWTCDTCRAAGDQSIFTY